MVFVGVYRAAYDYASTAENELSLAEGDLLCIVEKGDDDWWTAKKKARSEDEEEPEGLVPFNYLEEVTPTGRAKALYEYTRQTDEELSFGEDTVLDVYDTSDEDWTLVGSGGEFGFVPANYIEAIGGTRAAQRHEEEHEAPPPMPARPRAAAEEPEEHDDYSSASQVRAASSGTPAAALANILHAKTNEASPTRTRSVLQPPADPLPPRKKVQFTPESSEEEAPKLPRRPPSEQLQSVAPAPTTRHVSIREPEQSTAGIGVLPSPPHNRAISNFYDEDRAHSSPGGYHLYNVHEMVEIMGKNRRAPITLGINIAKGIIMLSPENSPSSQEWTADKLNHYSIEGKHVFMELNRPHKSVDLHAGARETAQSIVAALGELAGAARAEGLREVIAASSGTEKTGKILYEFNADEDNEVSVFAGEEVIILDDAKDNDWWLVRRIKDGKIGTVPASYVEPIAKKSPTTQNGTKSFVEQNRLEEERLARESSKAKVGPGLALPERQSSLSQDGGRKRSSKDRGDKDKKEFPNPRKVRTWTDRTGGFKVEAEFVGYKDGKIHLHKVNGVKIAVPIEKMSGTDIEHVEKVTGRSLDEEKSLADLKRSRTSKRDQPGATVEKKPEYDWFDFFLGCGVNPQICERYAQAFRRDEMGEEVMPEISAELLRKLGLKEGDILRVMKFLDNKYGRNKDTPTGTGSGGLFTGPGGALRDNTSKKTRPTPANPAKDAVDEKAFEPKSAGAKTNEVSKPQKSIIDGFDDDAWEVRESKQPTSPTVKEVLSPLAATPVPSSVVSELSGLSLSSPPLQPTPAATPATEVESPQPPAVKQGATPSLFEQLAKSAVAQPPQQTEANISVPRQRPQAPQQTQTQNSLIAPPPARAVSAPQSGPFPPPGQQQMGMQPLQAQLTGYPGPMMQTQVSPLGQSMHELNQQKNLQQLQLQQQRLMSQQTGMGFGGFPGQQGSFQQPQPTGMGFQQQPSLQQALVNGQQTGSPFADPIGNQYQPLMPMQTGMPMGMGGMNMPMYQQPQQTGINAFLPPALIPQQTGMLPQQTGINQFGINGSQQQAPPVPPLPSNIPIPPIPQQQPVPAPLVPQKTGPAPPVRFGVQPGAAKKLAPQPTGRRANLSQATPDNPFGF